MFYAVDENGNKYLFEENKNDKSTVLTLKKEKFQSVKMLTMLQDETKAFVGEDGFYILPRKLSMPGDALISFTECEDCEYTYKSPIMACFAVNTPDMCALVRVKRNYRFSLCVKVKDGVYSVAVMFDFTELESPVDDIVIELVPMKKDATAGDFAKCERDIRLERNEIKPLKDKCREREIIDYERRHPLIRIRLGWKDSPAFVKHQTIETEPPMYVAATFARVRDIADELKAQGVEGADLQLVGWNTRGHDGRYPQILPADHELGGDEELKKTIAHVKALGYKISLHINVMDSFEIAEEFSWDNVCVKKDGEYLQRGDFGGGLSYIVCPKLQVISSRRMMEQIKPLGLNGMHYTDVTSILEPDLCHSKDHPCSTRDGIEMSNTIIRETKEALGAFSSEGTLDFTLGELDYGLYVSMGNNFDNAKMPMLTSWIPFFELTYHGIVMYNPLSRTINVSIKDPRDQLYFYMRGGKPSFYFYSKFRSNGSDWMGMVDLTSKTDEELKRSVAKIKECMEQYKPFADRQLVYMKDYIVDGDIEVALYEDGVRVIGNFSDSDREYDGVTVKANSYVLI